MWSWETLRDFFVVPIYHLDETGRKVPLIGKAEVARQLLEARVRTEAVPDGVEILRAVPGSAARPRGETPPHSPLSHKLLVLQFVIQ